jgi:aryl-alcohol dehydrogenase-like predicted oxidoreductase
MVSPLGIGTVKWGRTEGLKHAPFALPSDETLVALLAAAEECGVNVLDTAPAYGVAEARLGQLLRGRREQFFISSKVGESFAGAVSQWDFSASAVRASVEQSLRRIESDALDLVLLHCPREDEEVILRSDALEVLQALKAQGKVRFVGVSSMTESGGMAAIPLCDAVMVSWNLGFREHESVIRAASAAGKGILLKKVLSSGHVDAVGTMAENLRAAAALPGRPVIVAGTLSPAHLRENAAALQLGR